MAPKQQLPQTLGGNGKLNESAGGGVSEAMVESVSGALASVVALLATFPIKTIYTHQALTVVGDGAAQSVLDIVRKYKLRGLYVGVEPNIIESAASSGCYFYLYSALRHWAVTRSQAAATATAGQGQQGKAPAAVSDKQQETGSTKHHSIGIMASLMVSSLAGMGNQLLTLPLTVCATRMQAAKKANIEGNTHKPSSLRSVISAIYQESGIGGFWAGLLPSMVLISNPVIQFLLYEQLLRVLRAWKLRHHQARQAAASQQAAPNSSKASAGACPACITAMGKSGSATDGTAAALGGQGGAECTCDNSSVTVEVEEEDPSLKVSAMEVFSVSALAKVGATIATYWLVVVKSRLQAGGKGKDARYTGTFDALTQIWKSEGIRGFTSGLKAKVLQTALNAALMLMIKEQLHELTKKALNGNALNHVRALVA
mmetsp:Transcript_21859/g.37345  ORF Transcript_21859/g.37345 Transcript_21859/m.37345 type:complete len:428 (+) Transcript_21859:27-1310(+)|eukprot:CAMPEP_0119108562 /NCGR_PEP_ID=MMETSP1180-20130426/15108_1 /TAXON_ID=3052 ORGANISM="Chlamydomonas cf sp, Strain CCMP681" /NCGR_SAMPLE_ID=MMETSP1180 /ASSEMBLY_ACC=CAM_ASM_000741 /LENGTH=427 /DNA_ID=CAMNT_0007094187 /DNA_START=19 /DNA_END=1302 /DNA_ORIENTATION=+